MHSTVGSKESASEPKWAARHRREILVIVGGALLIAIGTIVLSVRAERQQNHVELSGSPRSVSVVRARAEDYRDSRTYVGTVEPWVEADVGPQYIAAYVDSVLVRPGDTVHRGDILATLDCENPNAASRAAAMRAKAMDAEMHAKADEARRMSSMLDGGFVAENDVVQTTAASNAAQAELLETNARLLRAKLDVRDCILRAPFDGEIGTRTFDPGAFVHPGASIVSVVDRKTVRVTVDAPEKDFNALVPSTTVQIHMLAAEKKLSAPISRRAPRADPNARTIHFEVDLPDPDRAYPVGTTALVEIEVGRARAATEIPLYATTQQEGKAKLFVIDGHVAKSRTLPVLGESGGSAFFEPSALPAGTLVVTEGRALLSDGERVRYQLDARPGAGPTPSQNPARGGGYGRPL